MTTVTDMKTMFTETGATYNVEGIGAFEVGAMQSAKAGTEALVSTYALMVGANILPSDYLSFKNRESTASEAQWKARIEAASQICYTPAERAELETKALKDATQEQKDKRKALQTKAGNLLKNIRTGLTNAHKLADPDFYAESGGANEAKAAIEKLAKQIGEALKTLRGDGVFPDNFAHDDAVAVLVGFEKTFLK